MSKPKIAYLMQDFMIGGIPTFLYNIAKKLQDKFDFHFLATDNTDIHPHFNEVGTALYTGNNWTYVIQYLKENKMNIVQFGNCLSYKECALKAGIPIIIERTAGPRSCNLNREGVTHVISSTKGTVPLIKRNYGGPISILYNGIDFDRLIGVKPDRLHFKKDDFIVCYCARIGGIGQGFDVLIKAVLEARKTHDIKLVLIGDKPKSSAEDIRPMLRKLAKPMGNDCVFIGALLDPIPVMAGADLYICLARHHGISNSIIEISALGKPIIATDVGQTNEIVHNGKNGFLVKVGDIHAVKDLIIRFKDSPKKRKAFGNYGIDLVKREFNINIQSHKYAELYEKLLIENTN